MMLIKGGDEQLMYKASELAGFQDGMVGDGVARSSAMVPGRLMIMES
jgi:hypothetical protein